MNYSDNVFVECWLLNMFNIKLVIFVVVKCCLFFDLCMMYCDKCFGFIDIKGNDVRYGDLWKMCFVLC